jgi:hypothetical protein
MNLREINMKYSGLVVFIRPDPAEIYMQAGQCGSQIGT